MVKKRHVSDYPTLNALNRFTQRSNI